MRFAPFYCPPETQNTTKPVGAELARDSGLTGKMDVECYGPIASKLGSYNGSAYLDRFSDAKKRATEVAQNALRAHCFQKDLRFALVRIFPDKKSKPCKKQNHEADCQHSGDHHVVEKHDWPPAVALLRWG
ncbi:hypothetical protein KW848_06395 [Pseudomonas sp. PDM25]|nr:hypothetical protein [Pseudomonas sp. PDM25]